MLNWFYKHDGSNSIIFVQESHSSAEVENKWKKRWRGDIIFSHGDTDSRGVMILLGKHLDSKELFRVISSNGRYIILGLEICGKSYILINTYAPNDENSQVNLFNEIQTNIFNLKTPQDAQIIWGGDFNLYFDLQLEAKGGNPRKNAIQ